MYVKIYLLGGVNMAEPKAKLPYDLELIYHSKIKQIADKLTSGNKTQAVRIAIDKLFKEVVK